MQKSRVRRSYPPTFAVELAFQEWEQQTELVD